MIKLKKVHLSEVSEASKLSKMEMKHFFGGNGGSGTTTKPYGSDPLTVPVDNTYVKPYPWTTKIPAAH